MTDMRESEKNRMKRSRRRASSARNIESLKTGRIEEALDRHFKPIVKSLIDCWQFRRAIKKQSRYNNAALSVSEHERKEEKEEKEEEEEEKEGERKFECFVISRKSDDWSHDRV